MARLLNIHGVCDLTGLSRSTIERLVKADVFPKPVQMTAARLGWPEDEVLAFNRDRIAARRETEIVELRVQAGKAVEVLARE